ncbi:unnamed protein product [Menidia menidia]|uniref:(Atlantic silverside) hypothetical protein n=1 Tax=Menidia menidia TaxID=238744 RepID=A0A8S4B8M0_9TELE|nr:unnamed protein product [Menidia menidia]
MHHKSCSALCQHLKFYHGLYPAKNLRLKCGEQGCFSSFCTYKGFRKHLHSVHSYDRQVETHQAVVKDTHSQEELLSDQPSSSVSISQTPTVTTQKSIVGMCGSIVAHLQASGLSESAVQTIICSVEEVVSDVQSQAREVTLKTSPLIVWSQTFTKEFEYGPLKSRTANSLEGGDLLSNTLNLDSCSNILTTNWVRNYGTEYQVGLFICTAMSNDLPVFNKICHIIIHKQQAFIIGCAANTLYFDEHFHAYRIEEKNNEHVICIDKLTYVRPFDRQYSNESENIYIVPHCYMF